MINTGQIMPFLMTLVIQGIFLNFVLKLERKQCECSGTWGRDIMYYYSLLILAVILLSLVTMVGSLIIIKV